MIEYKWEILRLNVIPSLDGNENIVKSVNWRFMAREDIFFGDVYEVTELEYPKSESFIKYENLTEETVVLWVKNNIDYDDLVFRAEEILQKNKTPNIIEKEPPFIKEEKYTSEEEYLIVIDGNTEKSWGPLKWDSLAANDGLVHYGITNYAFPFNITMYQKELLPINSPYVVNDRIAVYRVEYTEKPETYNELTEYAGELTWVLDTGKAVGTYFIHQKTIDEVKELLRGKVLTKFESDFSENKINVEIRNNIYVMSADTSTMYFLALANDALNYKETTILKLSNLNSYLELNKQDLETLSTILYNHRDTIMSQEKQTVDAINAATTIEELKAIGV